MPTFTLTIACDNDAFANGHREREVARILRELADRMRAGAAPQEGRLRDINGNRVGDYGFRTD